MILSFLSFFFNLNVKTRGNEPFPNFCLTYMLYTVLQLSLLQYIFGLFSVYMLMIFESVK